MTDKLLLTIADKINEIYNQLKKNKENKLNSAPPRIVMVGTQSSGKSSIVNRITGLELVPTGENMVTRTPANIRLHYVETAQNMTLVLSMLKDGELIEVCKCVLAPDNRQQKLEQFRSKIAYCTDQITKNKWSISETPLFIDIYSNKVIDFSFVDLPGQVAIACTDKGQSEQITDEIEMLIRHQIEIPNTIVLTVIQSKTDLETDIGLALIKKIQSKCKTFTTVGVITKPDLLDNLDHLNTIIAGNISKNVMLDGGYFVINNKTDSPQKENEWFLNNFDNKKEIIVNKRYGIINLTMHLQKYLLAAIKKNLPEIKKELFDILKTQKTKLSMLGTELKDTQAKMNYFGRVVHQFDTTILNCLESNGSTESDVLQNIGSHIGQSINEFIVSMTALNPFSPKIIDDMYFTNIINSFKGYHLTTQVSIEHLIDKCIKDNTKNPLMKIVPISNKCIDSVTQLLMNLINDIVKANIIYGLEAYPKMRSLILNTLMTNIQKNAEDVMRKVNEYLENEQDFIWSTDSEFKKILNGSTQASNYSVEQIRLLTFEYFKTIRTRAVDYIIKLIISGTVKKLERNVNNDLNQIFVTQSQPVLLELFSEDSGVAKERIILSNNITKIEEVINIMNSEIC